MPYHKGSPGCSCCGCNYATDNFNRAAVVLGDKWDIRTGSPTIAANRASFPANSRAIHTTPGVLSDPLVVETIVRAPTSGDVARLILGWKDDDNYLFTQLTIGALTSSARLWRRVGGVETALAAAFTTPGGINTNLRMRNCYRHGMLSAAIGPFLDGTNGGQTAPATALGNRCGLATGAVASSIAFDDFAIGRGKDESRPKCAACNGGCVHCADGGPGLWKTVFSGITTNSCSHPSGDLNGTYFVRDQGGGPCSLVSDTINGTPNYRSQSRISITSDATTVTIAVRLRLFFLIAFTSDVVYETTLSKPLQCLEIRDLVIPFSRMELACGGSTAGFAGSQCTLSAL